jgi:hypothetical protein
MKDKINWKYILKENRNIFQRINDHLGTEKTQILIGATKDCILVPTGNKLALLREIVEGLYSREWTPCAEEIQLGEYLINL